MLLWLLEHWQSAGFPPATEKITLRAGLAAAAGFFIALLLGPRVIRWLSRRWCEPVGSPSQELTRLQSRKPPTPTMGGLFILGGLAGAVLLFGDLGNPHVQNCMLLGVGLAAIGAIDDLIKLHGKGRGLSASAKLAGQVLLAGLVAVRLYNAHAPLPQGLDLQAPGLEPLEMGAIFVPWAVLVITGTSNAVNLADGLDGLAAGCLIFATAAVGATVYLAGHGELANYLAVLHVPAAGEATIVAGGLIGALLAFLWFNCHPAQVFMGDTGSLPLGGLVALLALIARQELLLIVIGGVFVAEAASVILQVAVFRWRRRRVLRCAPLHHHYQFLGWPENRIVVRFWIAAALCAIVGLAGLKLQGGAKLQPPSAHAAAGRLEPNQQQDAALRTRQRRTEHGRILPEEAR